MPAVKLLAGAHALGEAIAAGKAAGQADRQPVIHDRQVQHDLALAVGIVAQRCLDAA